MTIAGKIIDATTKEPVPGATVSLHSINVQLVAAAANSSGFFSLSTPYDATDLKVTAVGYFAASFPMAEVALTVFSGGQLVVGMKRDYQSLENVTVHSSKKSGLPLWLLFGLLFLIKKQSR